MSQLNDARVTAIENLLGTEPGAHHHNELVLEWLQLNGATSDDLVDAWREMLEAQLTEPMTSAMHRNDMWKELLRRQGYDAGQINDAELSFWRDGGILV